MITFSTKHSNSLTYLQAEGEQLLHLMGCLAHPRQTGSQMVRVKQQGILPHASIDAAISNLKQHCLLATKHTTTQSLTAPEPEELQAWQQQPISLATRVFPLLMMLQLASCAGQPVIWRHSTCRRMGPLEQRRPQTHSIENRR